jgi:transposase
VLAARSPVRPAQVVEAARKALAEAEAHTITLSAAYDRLRAAEVAWTEEENASRVTDYDAKGLPTTSPPLPRSRSSKARKLRIEWVKAMAAQGATSDEIALRLGIGTRAVWQIVKDEGLVIPADKAMAKTPRKAFDPARAMTAIATDLDALVWSLDRINPDSLDPAQAADWAAQLHAHALTIRRVSRRISPKKENDQ